MFKSFLKNNWLALLLTLIMAAFVITVCSQSSPIYPLNTWNDANCYMFEAKSVANGATPWVDIGMQKGPTVLFIWLLCVPLGWTGVWILEVLAAWMFLFIAYKVSCIFMNSSIAYLSTAFTALMVYTSKSFAQGGSVEEFFLPFIALCFWFVLKNVSEKTRIKKYRTAIIGAVAGIIFMGKYSLCVLFAVLFIAETIFYLRKFSIKDVLLDVWPAVVGFVIAAGLPWVYLAYTGSVSAFVSIYFGSNLTTYAAGSTHFAAVLSFLMFSIPLILTCLISIPVGRASGMPKINRLCLYLAFLSFVVCLLIPGRPWPYYFLPAYVFAPYFIATVVGALTKDVSFKKKSIKIVGAILACLICASCAAATPNKVLMFKNKEDTLIGKLSAYIKPESSVLILSDTSSGIFVETNSIPTESYLYGNTADEKVVEKYRALMKNREVDYIVARFASGGDDREIDGYVIKARYVLSNVTDTDDQEYLFIVYEKIPEKENVNG